MSSEPEQDAAREALLEALGALLADADVAAVHAVERGAVEVTRRGRRERLGVALPDAVFTALAALGARERRVELDVDGERVRVQPVAGERLLLYLEKRAASDARLSELVEEGMLPAEAALSLTTVARAGHGLVVVGTPHAAMRRLALAVARELSDSAPVMALDETLGAAWLLPAPRVEGDVVARARACVTAGAEVLLALQLDVDEAKALAAAALPTSAVVTVRVPSAPAFAAAFARGESAAAADALASQLCVVGRAPGGRPVLVEQHVPEGAPSAPLVGAAPSVGPSFAPAVEPASLSPAPERAPRAVEPQVLPPPRMPSSSRGPMVDPSELPPLPPLGSGPPAGWASSQPDDDPGWELGETREPPQGETMGRATGGPSAFDDVFSQVKARPTFTPRPPPAHPQTRALRGDPFGGLTLEPPGGALDDDEEDATKADEDER